MTETVTPETILEAQARQAYERYEQTISALVEHAQRQILKKFKAPAKPIKVAGLIHPLLLPLSQAARRDVADRLSQDGWLVEFPSWRHPLRLINGITLISAA